VSFLFAVCYFTATPIQPAADGAAGTGRGRLSDQLLENSAVDCIAKSQDEKIRRFQEQQLEQGYKKPKSI
jgi:hypothetical protein